MSVGCTVVGKEAMELMVYALAVAWSRRCRWHGGVSGGAMSGMCRVGSSHVPVSNGCMMLWRVGVTV